MQAKGSLLRNFDEYIIELRERLFYGIFLSFKTACSIIRMAFII